MVKIGDNVRFLNAVGGGKVRKIDEKKGLVYVEDEDGFEVPALIRECVVIQALNEKTNFPVKDFSSKQKPEAEIKQALIPEIAKPETPIVETKEGETLKVLLAFFPDDIKKLQSTDYECYLVNDSNYFLYYNFVIGQPEKRISVANGLIEPNMQELLSALKKENLNDWENIHVQILPFKKEKIYSEQNSLDFHLKQNPVKFYKLHAFTENDYFEEPALLIDLTEEVQKKKLINIEPEKIKEAIFEKKEEKRPRFQPVKPQREVIEVDLHINQLIDNTTGLSNADMLQHQMDIFHKTIEENKQKKGQKIVFIHGKGEGVLRKEIEKQLKNRYKNYYFQDASFREYGFGATMVTIR